MIKKADIVPFNKINASKKIFKNKKTVLVGGCFDLIHFGHLEFLKKAKQSGDYLIVALESDEFIKRNKRNEPIHPQEERAEILSCLNMVDMIINLPYFSKGKEYLNMVKKISPNIIAVTEGDKKINSKKEQAKMVGAEVKIVTPLVKKYSTRKIISELD